MKVIVVGAGAAGLMAAHTLASGGVDVLILEAGSRIGGRIHTLTPPGFTNQVEAGAEFVHGKLPLTFRLMKRAGIPLAPVGGEMLSISHGSLKAGFGESKAWRDFMERAAAQTTDCTVDDLLRRYFSAKKYSAFRREVRDMAQGLDLADSKQLSVFSIRDEWASTEAEYRPLTGYAPLLEFLRNSVAGPNYSIKLNAEVTSIEWEAGRANVYTQDELFSCEAVILAVPLAVYHKEYLSFKPSITRHLKLFHKIGLGQVIKIVLEFEYAFWEESHPEMGFLFTESGYTFWTQLSLHKPILTGWLGNDFSRQFSNLPDSQLIKNALPAISAALKVEPGRLDRLFKTGAVFRYTSDSAFGGGYSYLTPQSNSAIKELLKGLSKTLWFAGEALNHTLEVGTVEAALQSGRSVALKLLKASQKRS